MISITISVCSSPKLHPCFEGFCPIWPPLPVTSEEIWRYLKKQRWREMTLGLKSLQGFWTGLVVELESSSKQFSKLWFSSCYKTTCLSTTFLSIRLGFGAQKESCVRTLRCCHHPECSKRSRGWWQPLTGELEKKGRKWCMNLLQALAILTLIILSTPRSTLERETRVWGGGSPSGMRSFISAWSQKPMNQPFLSRLKNPQCAFSLLASLLCIKLNTHLRLNGCRITLDVKYHFYHLV